MPEPKKTFKFQKLTKENLRPRNIFGLLKLLMRGSGSNAYYERTLFEKAKARAKE